MTALRIKRIFGLLFLCALIGYFGFKLFRTVDDTLLAVFILITVILCVLLVMYVLRR